MCVMSVQDCFLSQNLWGYASLNDMTSEALVPEPQLPIISLYMQPRCCREMMFLVKSCLSYQQATTFKEYFFPVRPVTF